MLYGTVASQDVVTPRRTLKITTLVLQRDSFQQSDVGSSTILFN